MDEETGTSRGKALVQSHVVKKWQYKDSNRGFSQDKMSAPP